MSPSGVGADAEGDDEGDEDESAVDGFPFGFIEMLEDCREEREPEKRQDDSRPHPARQAVRGFGRDERSAAMADISRALNRR